MTSSFLLLKDENLDQFLYLVNCGDDGKISNKIGEIGFENLLKERVEGLTKANIGPLVRFLPLILDKLIQLMVRPPVVLGAVGKSS